MWSFGSIFLFSSVMCHRHIPSSKRNPPLKIFARSSETYFAASYQTSTSLDEFRNFSEYSEIYSLPFPPYSDSREYARNRWSQKRQGFSSAGDSREYARNRCRQGANQPRLLQILPKVLPSWIKKLFWIVWNVLWGEKSSFSSRFFSQIAPLSSLEEAVETEVFHSQPSARTEGNRTCSDCRGEQQGKSLLLTFKQTIQNSF